MLLSMIILNLEWNRPNQNDGLLRICNGIMQLISYKDAWQSQGSRATASVQYSASAFISNCYN